MSPAVSTIVSVAYASSGRMTFLRTENDSECGQRWYPRLRVPSLSYLGSELRGTHCQYYAPPFCWDTDDNQDLRCDGNRTHGAWLSWRVSVSIGPCLLCSVWRGWIKANKWARQTGGPLALAWGLRRGRKGDILARDLHLAGFSQGKVWILSSFLACSPALTRISAFI